MEVVHTHVVTAKGPIMTERGQGQLHGSLQTSEPVFTRTHNYLPELPECKAVSQRCVSW